MTPRSDRRGAETSTRVQADYAVVSIARFTVTASAYTAASLDLALRCLAEMPDGGCAAFLHRERDAALRETLAGGRKPLGQRERLAVKLLCYKRAADQGFRGEVVRRRTVAATAGEARIATAGPNPQDRNPIDVAPASGTPAAPCTLTFTQNASPQRLLAAPQAASGCSRSKRAFPPAVRPRHIRSNPAA